MSTAQLDSFDRAVNTANVWLAGVAEYLGTEDRRFAYRVLRGWMHTLRDRLPVEGAARFATQLPELLRGVYYDGWVPATAPVKYGHAEFVQRFSFEARLPPAEVEPAARAVTAALAGRMSPGHLSHALGQLPQSLRAVLDVPRPPVMPARPTRPPPGRSLRRTRPLARAWMSVSPGLSGRSGHWLRPCVCSYTCCRTLRSRSRESSRTLWPRGARTRSCSPAPPRASLKLIQRPA